jgi:DNA-binding MarR family transcriptional regulator
MLGWRRKLIKQVDQMGIRTRGSARRSEIEAAKRVSAGHLLLKAARLLNERATARVREASKVGFRTPHTALLPHIDFEGTRLTDLAARVGTSKQAVGELVAELEQMGLVRRDPDPADARARLVRFTAHGRRALLHGLSILSEIEAELAAEIGRARMDRLRADLGRLLAALERSAGRPRPG